MLDITEMSRPVMRAAFLQKVLASAKVLAPGGQARELCSDFHSTLYLPEAGNVKVFRNGVILS